MPYSLQLFQILAAETVSYYTAVYNLSQIYLHKHLIYINK
jgi:hypothetical protein